MIELSVIGNFLFSTAFLYQLRSRVSLSGFIGRYVGLKRKGEEYLGLCPFHGEKTPSFTVNEIKGFYHCFGCGAHGDIISFVQHKEKCSFKEAVVFLSEYAGISVPIIENKNSEKKQNKEALHKVFESACRWFEQNLLESSWGGERARAYLDKRAITLEDRKSFRLGWAPYSGLGAYLYKNRFSQQICEEAGLLQKGGNGEFFDWFRERLIFPILDKQGRVIAFGGRTLGEMQPKYLNSKESCIFSKSYELYGNFSCIKSKSPWVIVEGYTDVIALSRYLPAVAPLGTALSEHQLNFIWRFSKEPYVCFDGDKAGFSASIRIAQKALGLLKPGYTLYFCRLPSAEDPHSLLKNNGFPGFESHLKKALPLAEFLWQLCASTLSSKLPEKKAQAYEQFEKYIDEIRDPIVKQSYKNFYYEKKRNLYTTITKNKNNIFFKNSFTPFLEIKILLGVLLYHPYIIIEVQENLTLLNLSEDSEWENLCKILLEWESIKEDFTCEGEKISHLQEFLCKKGVRHLVHEIEEISSHIFSFCKSLTKEELKVQWIQFFNAYQLKSSREIEMKFSKQHLIETHDPIEWGRLKKLREIYTT